MKGVLAAIAFVMIGTVVVGTMMTGAGAALAAAAAPQIPASESPGRERERFTDPPGAKLLQRNQPSTVPPYGTRPFELSCRPRAGKRKAPARRRC